MKGKFVYHASKTTGLTKIEPNTSTHMANWVYATKNIETAAMFLGENYDLICQTGSTKGKPFVFERFKGALKLAYAKKKGSIYKLLAKDFEEGKTDWTEEVVSTKAQEVQEEIVVPDALKFLEKLAMEKKLTIYKFPRVPKGTPTDKSDIIERAVEWTTNFGEHILDDVAKYHPDILPEVLQKLKARDTNN